MTYHHPLVVKQARSILKPNPWRHPIRAWRMRRLIRDLNAVSREATSLVTPEAEQRMSEAEQRFITG